MLRMAASGWRIYYPARLYLWESVSYKTSYFPKYPLQYVAAFQHILLLGPNNLILLSCSVILTWVKGIGRPQDKTWDRG
jgi:hypothetical protein